MHSIRYFWSGEGDKEVAEPGQDPHDAPDLSGLWVILDTTPSGAGQIDIRSCRTALKRQVMTSETRRLAGILLIVLPAVIYGGVSILSLMVSDPAYMTNPLRQDFWRAGHAHAAVLIILSLVLLPYVE